MNSCIIRDLDNNGGVGMLFDNCDDVELNTYLNFNHYPPFETFNPETTPHYTLFLIRYYAINEASYRTREVYLKKLFENYNQQQVIKGNLMR